MTEVKNYSMDFVSRQVSDNTKKEDKTVEGHSGFKTMLKDRNIKKDSGKSDNQEAGSDTETAAAEAAASAMAAGVREVQTTDGKSREMGPKAICGLAEDGLKTAGVQEVILGEGDMIQKLNTFQSMDQLRLQKSTGKPLGVKQPEEGATSLITDGVVEKTEAGLKDEMVMAVKGLQWNVSDEGRIAVPVMENEKNIQMPKLTPAQDMELKEKTMAVSAQSGEEVQVIAEKEDKKPENSVGLYQEKSHEPDHSFHIRSDKDAIAYTTVNAEKLENLEGKLSEQILSHIHTGKKALEVQLEPHNLGKIQIKVSYEDNQVSVSVICTESKTLRLLSQSAGDLGTILQNNLERPVQIIVDKQEGDYLNNHQQQGGRQEQHGQNQGSPQEQNREDFMQKLRLGILETESTDNGYTDYV